MMGFSKTSASQKPAGGAAGRMPLSSVASGHAVRLAAVHGGQDFRARLSALGLIPGAAARVIRNGAAGPLIVGVKESRIVLGRGAAHKVEVDEKA